MWKTSFFFHIVLHFLSPSIFIPSSVPSQSEDAVEIASWETTGMCPTKTPNSTIFFSSSSLSFAISLQNPNLTPPPRRAAKIGFHSFIFSIISRLSVDFTSFTADNGVEDLCVDQLVLLQNFTLRRLPSRLHNAHTPIYSHSQRTVGC